MGKKLLTVSTNHWTSPYHVGTHSISEEFVKQGWDVYFISNPLSPFHLFSGNKKLVRERFELYKEGGRKNPGKDFTAYVPFTLLPPQNFPLLRSEYVYRNWYKFTIPPVVKKIKEAGFGEADLIMFDNSRQNYLLDNIEHKSSVFRITDNYKAYGTFTENTFNADRELARKAGTVIYTASNLKEYAYELVKRESHYVPNGVDYGHFSRPAPGKPEEYKDIEGPIIVYAGETELRFDSAAIRYAAEKLPGVTFVIIGEKEKPEKYLSGLRNIVLTGTKPFNSLPEYFQFADAGIIPFRVKELPELINYVNPLKMYQYFAAGLPVVASGWPELAKTGAPVLLYDDYDELVNNIKKTLNVKTDKKELQEYARQTDWRNVYNKIVELAGLAE